MALTNETQCTSGRGGAFTVTSDQADRRLDRVLRGLYKDIPLGAIMKAIRKGAVRVNGAKKSGGDLLCEDDVVSVPWQVLSETHALPVRTRANVNTAALATLFKSHELWCVDKSAGLLSQPDRSAGDSVITRAWAEMAWTRVDFRPALIHRLDRNVSGVMAIALTAPLLRTLSELMRNGLIRKIYRAVVLGKPEETGEIRMPLYKDEEQNKVSVDPRGQEALTRFTTLCSNGKYSLVELELVTGRPHQARVHLSQIGHPILGDVKYGGKENRTEMNQRLFLHAYSLSFPKSDDLSEEISGATITSRLPSEFTKFVPEFT